ncbi:precorrin-3B C(17)-methyltransferase [Eubacteriales bacterium OttesenSCG-928-A19]|nr:precorrin-3B C(17)-methyltransferase [Eubacteriales bacterium OttesenSCG-928-A19]
MAITVVGIGPGHLEGMTGEAVSALGACDTVVGYTAYVDLVRPHFPDKRYLQTGMRGEEARCALAVAEAAAGHAVCVVCSGDAGVYGLAGLVMVLAQEAGVPVRVVPGVTAALSGAALLGAPLVHDFACVSLSDLLTPWETIAARLDAAARADFVLCLYNPMSHKRRDHLPRACDIILRHRAAGTLCGLAWNIGREGEGTRILTLGELRDTQVDMFTTVFIGNRETRRVGDSLVTPRGYEMGRDRAFGRTSKKR